MAFYRHLGLEMSIPDLPDPAHAEVDSMLSRRFGRETANYFAGSPLNRVSFLRTDHKFLTSALTHASSSFLLLNELEPLLRSPGAAPRLAFLNYEDVRPVLSAGGGTPPFALSEEDRIKAYDSTVRIPQLVFLGIDERKTGIDFKEGRYSGQPFWALDVTTKEKSTTDAVGAATTKLRQELKAKGLSFSDGRQMVMSLPAEDAAIFAEARQILDWNNRNPFCAACGQSTMSTNAGFKRTCPPADAALGRSATSGTEYGAPFTDRPACATRSGPPNNLSFPRTDIVVIMAIVSSDGSKALLGRQKRFPPHWYSTLAGFLEPAESMEEAVRREVWEESGIVVGRVIIHSTQPWPYPANIMVGAIGQSIAGKEEVSLSHDAELEDAKWVSLEDVRVALRDGTSNLGEEAGPNYKEGNVRLPPKTAIAHTLLAAIADGIDGLGGSKI